MKMRFEIPLSDLKPQALRGYRRRTEEVSQFRDILCAWASEHGPGRLQNPVLRRSYAPTVAAHTRPLPLQAICRRLPRCRHALRARAAQAGRDIAFGLESNVPSRKDSGLFARAIHRRPAERA